MIRKILQRLAYLAAGVLLFLAIGGTALYFFFPKKKLQHYLLTTLGNVFDRRIEIGSLRINPFKGIIVNGLAMYDPESFGGAEFISVGRVVLKYRLLPLLDRKILVDEIAISQPSVTFTRTRDGALNVDDLLRMVPPADTAAADTAAPDTAAFSFVFDVRSVAVTDIRAALDGPLKISLSGLTVSADNAVIRPPADYRGAVRITAGADRAPNLIVIQNTRPDLPEKMLTCLQLDLRVEMAGLHDISVRGPAILHLLETVLRERLLPRVSAGISLDTRADITGGNIRIGPSSLLFQEQEALTFSAGIHGLYGAPAGTLQVTGGTLSLGRVSALLSRFVPGITAGGSLSLKGSSVTFAADSSFSRIRAAAGTRVRLDGLRFSDAATDLSAAAGPVTFDGRHRISLQPGGGTLTSSGSAAMERVTLHLDTLAVPFDGLTARYEADTDSAFIPRSASVTAVIRKIFDGSVSLDLAAGSRDGFKNNITLRTLVSAEQLNLEQVPLLPLQGRCDAAVTMAGSTFSDIRTSVTARLDGLSYALDETRETLPPFRFETAMRLGADYPAFSEVSLSDITGTVGDLLSFRAEGNVREPGAGDISLTLTESALNLGRLPAWLPASLLSSVPVLDSMEISGTVRTTADVRAALPAADTAAFTYEAGAGITLDGIAVSLPAAGINSSGINGTVQVAANPVRISPDADITVSEVSVPAVREAPFRDAFIRLSAGLDDYEDVSLHSLAAGLRELGITVRAEGTVTGLSHGGRADLSAGLSMAHSAPVEPLPGLAVSGGMEGAFGISVPDLTRLRPALAGTLQLHGISLALDEDIRAAGINGTLYLEYTFDLDSMRIIPGDKQMAVPDHDHPSYDALRNLLRPDLPGLSTLSVRRVEYGPYYLDGISTDLLLKNTVVDAREFRIDGLYGGNLVGSFRADLGNGRLDDISRQLKYRFYAQLAEASAESLIRSIPALRNTRSAASDFEDEMTSICADFSLTGTGFDLAANPDMEGSVNFTKIGPKTTIRLLDLLDPEQKDRSFNSVRLLINNGYRPGFFGAEIRHSNVYALIELDESRRAKTARLLTLGILPRIPQPIEFARKPLVGLISTLGLADMLKF